MTFFNKTVQTSQLRNRLFANTSELRLNHDKKNFLYIWDSEGSADI